MSSRNYFCVLKISFLLQSSKELIYVDILMKELLFSSSLCDDNNVEKSSVNSVRTYVIIGLIKEYTINVYQLITTNVYSIFY